MIAFLLAEHRRHPWMAPGLLITGSAALGTVLPALITFVAAVLR